MIGSHRTSTNEGRRLTTAGLIALTGATLLMMVWAIFPTAAFATVPWDGNGVTNGQFNNSDCDADPSPHIFWIFTGDPGPGLTDVTLTVNGTLVASRKLEPTNDRTLGLFRYSDASGVRIRNITHRGHWPTALLPVEKQELAAAK